MATSLNSILQTRIQVKVVDVGANPVDGKPSYFPLVEQGVAKVVGFEPEPKALAELNAKKGPNETYLHFVVGDGKIHALHFCAHSAMTSLFPPNPAVLNLLQSFPEWTRVVKTEEVQTTRLEDLPETAEFDYLKLDIQGAELMVLENATAGLKGALFIQTEVEFVPMYIGQPLFSDVDVFLRKHGFVLHRFEELISRVIKPLVVNNDIFAGLSQIFWTDALYVRDFTRLELMTSAQLLRLALILHDCYESYDLVLLLLLEHDRRTGSTLGPRYQKNGLNAQPASV